MDIRHNAAVICFFTLNLLINMQTQTAEGNEQPAVKACGDLNGISAVNSAYILIFGIVNTNALACKKAAFVFTKLSHPKIIVRGALFQRKGNLNAAGVLYSHAYVFGIVVKLLYAVSRRCGRFVFFVRGAAESIAAFNGKGQLFTVIGVKCIAARSDLSAVSGKVIDNGNLDIAVLGFHNGFRAHCKGAEANKTQHCSNTKCNNKLLHTI